MPRGRYSSHKGKHRHFTNPEELEEERRKDELKKEWRRKRGDVSSDEDEDGGESSSKPKPLNKGSGDSASDDDEEESSEEEGETKGKGVEKLIEISNPNRVQTKSRKIADLKLDGEKKVELSRREREELERQAADARYRKLHAEGKTQEAQADLARLAIIKQQREEAAKKREADRLLKDAEAKEKAAARNKALGKKS